MIAIHWGPPGSYKSSGVVQDVIVKAALEPTILEDKEGNEIVINGRKVVTNIRGMSTDRFHEVFGDEKILGGFEIIFIDTTTSAGREKILKFWHWAPQGALLVFDEAQLMFPRRLREKELSDLRYTNSFDEAEAVNRPHDWQQAWDQHRHYNWDIMLMAPNISKIHDDIRSSADLAYRHVNAMRLGIPGRYWEKTHDAQNNGISSQCITSERKKIVDTTFALYDSTKTGIVKDSASALNIFKQPKLLGLLLVIAFCGWSFASSPVPLSRSDATVVEAIAPAAPVASVEVVQGSRASRDVAADRVARSTDDKESDINRTQYPFAEAELAIVGMTRFGDRRDVVLSITTADGRYLTHNSRTLLLMGYRVVIKDRCLVTLIYDEFAQNVFCGPRAERARSDAERVPERQGTTSDEGEFLSFGG